MTCSLPAWHTPRPGWQSGTAGVETVLGHWMADWATHLVVGVSDSAGEQGGGGGGGIWWERQPIGGVTWTNGLQECVGHRETK